MKHVEARPFAEPEAAARKMLEGIVSKHRERRYRSRTCEWIKVKNRKHPAFSRVKDALS